jgi:hypothetical protein
VGGTMSRNDTSLPAQHPHSVGDGCTMRVCRTAPRCDFQAVSDDWRGGDSSLTRASAMCQSIQCPNRGSRYGAVGRERPRARRSLTRGAGSLERGGNSLEVVPSPRARWGFRGAAPAPRARRRVARGVPGPACLLGR